MAEQGSSKGFKPTTERNVYDDMHESYGEGYATRSSEEGFGGIYSSSASQRGGKKHWSRNRTDEDDDVDPIQEPVKEFDYTQGSPVAEKEKSSRHAGDGFTGGNSVSN